MFKYFYLTDSVGCSLKHPFDTGGLASKQEVLLVAQTTSHDMTEMDSFLTALLKNAICPLA